MANLNLQLIKENLIKNKTSLVNKQDLNMFIATIRSFLMSDGYENLKPELKDALNSQNPLDFVRTYLSEGFNLKVDVKEFNNSFYELTI